MSTAKSVRTKADNRRARIRINSMSMKYYFEDHAAAERGSLFKGEQQCSQCGFKARYEYFRCPNCDSEQAELICKDKAKVY
jgi:lipopolysaccharide biosynthesis regulator YciM